MKRRDQRYSIACLAAIITGGLIETGSPARSALAGRLLSSYGIAVAAAQEQQEAVVPLYGLDPVLLTQGKEVPGKQAISVTRGEYKYLFATAEDKAIFEKEPEKYEIQLGGSCARMGPQVGSSPDLFAVHKGRIYVFGSDECQRLFQQTPEKYLEPAPPEISASPVALKEGRALIEKVVAAAGGASRIDGLTTYQETGLATTATENGDVQYKTVTTRVFPGLIRREQNRNFGTVIAVLAPSGSFTIFQNDTRRNVRPIQDTQRIDLERQARRSIIDVLRARTQPDFKAVAVVDSKAADGIKNVDVAFGNVRLRLAVDTAAARIVSMQYAGRNPSNGEVGEIVQRFSDFRSLDGMSLPYKITGTFNGSPDAQQSYTVESIAINAKVDPALFERPRN